MDTRTISELKQSSCKPCEGGVDRFTPEQARAQLEELEGWELIEDGKAISKKWTVKNFLAGIEFLNKVAEVAEQDQHHPDLHLEGYRNVRIQLSTHAIEGLSENDFILAAKIDDLPVEKK